MPSFIADRLRHPDSLGKLGFWVFVGFGAVAVIGGVFLTFQDPGGIALIAFGAIFIGAGFLAKKLFTAPDGKKSVLIGEDAFTATSTDGRTAQISSGSVIHVDEDASPEEIEAAKAAWAAEKYAAIRPDWRTGRIPAESARKRVQYVAAAVVWGGFAGLALAAALIWGDIAWLVAAGGIVVASVLAFQAGRDAARRRKFGESEFLMRDPPARLGGVFAGEVQTSIPFDRIPDGGFELTLTCERRWEERTSGNRAGGARTVQRSETVWRATGQAGAEAGANGGLKAQIAFDLPEDAPPTTLGQINTGTHWELSIKADMPGVDYAARFVAPVLYPGTQI